VEQLEQLLAAEHAARALRESVEQRELAGGQRDRPGVDGDLHGGGIDHELADHDALGAGPDLAARASSLGGGYGRAARGTGTAGDVVIAPPPGRAPGRLLLCGPSP